MKKILIVLGVMGVLFLSCAGFFVYRIATMDPTDMAAAFPGGVEFQAANDLIRSFDGEEAFGNTDEARELAAVYAELIKALDEASFSGGKKEGAFSSTDGHFLTYCQLNEDSVCFLIHVPQLKRYKKDVRDALIDSCWQTAQFVVKQATDADVELAVGLRGTISYGGSAIGRSTSSSPKTENSFMVLTNDLYKYFAPVDEEPVTEGDGGTDEAASDDDAAAKDNGGDDDTNDDDTGDDDTAADADGSPSGDQASDSGDEAVADGDEK